MMMTKYYTYIDVDYQDLHFLYMHSLHNKNDEYLRNIIENMESKLANILSDYLLHIVYGEGRHINERSSCFCKNLYFEKLLEDETYIYDSYTGRATIYNCVTKFLKKNKLSRDMIIHDIAKIKDCFYNCRWDEEYGGETWGDIAKLLLNYLNNKLSKTIFIDSVKYLAHNSDIIFNKKYICHIYSYLGFKSFLDSTTTENLCISHLSYAILDFLNCGFDELQALHNQYCDNTSFYTVTRDYQTILNTNFNIINLVMEDE